MRAKVVLSASVLALVVLLPAIYFHFKPSQSEPTTTTPPADASASARSNLPPILKRASLVAQDQAQGVTVAANDTTGLSHEEIVTKRKADLYEMGMSQDPASLKVILTEMHNADPEIRKAALSATLDFGSPDAIPALQNELSWAEDLEEKVAIQKAIEFLQLPSFGSNQQSTDGAAPATN